MKAVIIRFPLTSYFLLAYLLTWSTELPMLLAARDVLVWQPPHWLEALAGFGPFVAALVVLQLTQGAMGVRRLFASLTHWRVPAVWLGAAVLSPFIIMFIALAMTGETEKLLSGAVFAELSASGKLVELILVGGILRGLGEEPGWRGFALPVLRSRFGPLLATLALWPVWLLWHLPSFLARPELQLAAGIGFSVGILSAAAWCTLLYDKTRSVLMIALWHALINVTRGIALAASSAAFLAFSQVMLGVGLIIVIYWLLSRPGKYPAEHANG
jgi:membrane protease YdiL (CAAX protease family)